MKEFDFTVEREFTATSTQNYHVIAEDEAAAMKMFEDAFCNCQEHLLRDGEEVISKDRNYSPFATAKMVGDDRYVLRMEFDKPEEK